MIGKIDPVTLDELQQLPGFFHFEGFIVFTSLFGKCILPGRQLIYIHGSQNGNDVRIITVAGRCLCGDHAIGGISHIDFLIIPYIIVSMQIEVLIQIRITFLFHNQIKSENAVCVF